MRSKHLVTLICLGLLVACSHVSGLEPIVLPAPIRAEFWLHSPYILTVRILRADTRGPVRKATVNDSGATVDVQLVEYTAAVEKVIQGGEVDPTIHFYIFVWLAHTPRHQFQPSDQPIIVFLQRSGGVLRAFADIPQHEVPLFTGRHHSEKVPAQTLGPGRTIAYLLLTPGYEFSPERFAQMLDVSTREARNYASPKYVFSLLTGLEANSDRSIRDEACIAMAGQFWIRPPCLADALDDTNPQIRANVRSLLDARQEKVNVAQVLREDPISIMSWETGEALLERLEIFTLDMRPDVRAAACDKLRTLSPERRFPNCK